MDDQIKSQNLTISTLGLLPTWVDQYLHINPQWIDTRGYLLQGDHPRAKKYQYNNDCDCYSRDPNIQYIALKKLIKNIKIYNHGRVAKSIVILMTGLPSLM